MKAAWVFGAVILAGTAAACLWDYDTLGMEIKGLPDVQDVIAGRFEVNPPEYYARRVELMEAERKAGTLGLDGYDNAAIAHDRLGHAEEALEWLEVKRKKLAAEQPKEAGDDWYRFYANRGTIFAHDWVRGGMGKDTRPLDAAISDLTKAVSINPEAHFGRETVQVELLEFARDAARTGHVDSARWRAYMAKDPQAVRQGLIGIMSLGAGWNSPDMHALLASTCQPDDSVIKEALLLRARQLAEQGQPHWIKDHDWEELCLAHYSAEGKERLGQDVSRLVSNGEEFRLAREKFMQEQLRAGKHPDKDDDFWTGYAAVPRAVLGGDGMIDRARSTARMWLPNLLLGGVCLLFVGGFVLAVRRKRAGAGEG